jgi:NAD(P)H-hydrate repair Nnr-like enzyme with NAD(P)H-hydrate dehydratase domain
MVDLQLSRGETVLDQEFAVENLPRRSFGAHKWSVGGLVIVAGGPGYIGAAALSAMAAGRAGAGVVNVAVPRGAMSAIVTLVPEAAFIPLPESDLESSATRVREALNTKLAKSRAAVVGPGLGQDEYADALMRTLFGRASVRRGGSVGFRAVVDVDQPSDLDSGSALIGGELPAVVDADGLNWLAKQTEWWKSARAGSMILTPHIGEMSRLTGKSAEELLSDPVGAAREAAREWRQSVVLKHGHTIATDGERSYISGDVALSLATGGSGDVLAGTIGSFLAQGVAPLEAAGLGIYLGTRAARRVEGQFGVLGLTASDLPKAIAEEIALVERKRDGESG